ncbi:MAG: pseudouridine synthase [Desulfovibrionaceae bacterium]|nr:pseudouridine synthase [Desulfovibrionaceae bacterium]
MDLEQPSPVVVVGPEFDGRRLDQALVLALPGTGLNLRRRAWDRGEVLVNGRPRPRSYKVRTGQGIEYRPRQALEAEGRDPAAGVFVVADNGLFAALFKPQGLDSEAVRGKAGPSAEAALRALWPDGRARLVNRLDRPTSGLLVVALGPEAERAWLDFQDQGLALKTYVALVRGPITGPMTIKNRLDVARRKKTRVLAEPDPDPLRWTEVVVLRRFEGRDATLVRALIRKGARHQIRAHLACVGHPIVGDALYGLEGPDCGRLYLHHLRVEAPGFRAQADPDWPDAQGLFLDPIP